MQFLFWEVCFEFSVLCLCSAWLYKYEEKLFTRPLINKWVNYAFLQQRLPHEAVHNGGLPGQEYDDQGRQPTGPATQQAASPATPAAGGLRHPPQWRCRPG